MNWDDVVDIIYDGTAEQIAAVRCPECGGKFKFDCCPSGYDIECKGCGTGIRAHGEFSTPNVHLFGIQLNGE